MLGSLVTYMIIWNEMPNLLRSFQKSSNASLASSMNQFKLYSTKTLERTVLCNEDARATCATNVFFGDAIWCTGIAAECSIYNIIYTVERWLGVDSLTCVVGEQPSAQVLFQETAIMLIRISERFFKTILNTWQYGSDMLYPNWQDVVTATQNILEPLVPVVLALWYSLSVVFWAILG